MVMDSSTPENVSGDQVEERANELINEFQEHLTDFIVAQPEHADCQREIFEAWAIQKIAGLQLCVEHMAENHNLHVQGHKLSKNKA